MHIRKLEICGFKSFPDRTAFHFGPGISGVVGPNGCGKSNVVDAVKWCLGEQSAKSLRGSSMHDVIFAGTQARPAMGLAEVSLTFAADDVPFAGEYARHAEVRIMRRLYRDGESEYRINDARCRLKDIHDLFLDTGANNRMYSFIEQGRIGQIVNAKPEQRRALIEEAAGISRYKARKEEADRKLAGTLDNLEAAGRTLDELRGRLRSLERQVRKAVRYRRLRSRVRQGEVFLGLARFAGLVGDRRALGQDLRKAQSDEAAVIRRVSRQEAALTQARAGLRKLEDQAGALRDQLAELEATRRESESARQFQEREADELTRRIERLTEDASRSQTEQLASKARHDEARRELDQVTASLDGLQGRLEQARQAQGRADAAVRERRRAIEAGKDAVLASVQTLAKDRAAVDVGRQRLAELKDRHGRLSHRTGQVGADIDRLVSAVDEAVALEQSADERLAAARDALGVARGAEAEARQALAGLQQGVKEAEAGRRSAEGARGRAAGESARIRARVEALEALQASHAGVSDALKPALAVDGVLGTLAEHLDVAPADEALVAAILGPSLELVLARDDDTAVAAARAAGDTGGRVAVLSLSSGSSSTEGLAGRLGGTEPGRTALHLLFGDARTVDDARSALETRRPGEGPVLILGDQPALVDRSGVLRLGSDAGAGMAIIARRRELAETRERLEVAEAAEAGAEEALRTAESAVEDARRRSSTAAEAVQGAADRVSAARESAGDAELAARVARKERQDRERERAAEQARRERMDRDLAGIVDQIRATEAKLEEQLAAITQRQDTQAAAEERLHQDQAALVDEEQAAETAREQRSGLSAEAATLTERKVALGREVASAQQAASQAAARHAATEEEVVRSRARIDELATERERLAVLLQELTTKQGVVDEEHATARAAVTTERGRIGGLEDTLRQERDAQQAAMARRAELEQQLTQVKTDIAHIRDSLEERHQLSAAGLLDRLDRVGHVVVEADRSSLPGEVAPEEQVDVDDLRITRPDLEDEAAVSGWVDALQKDRAALQRLGEVNLVAQQEYDEVRERHGELDARREDLEDSVKVIRQTIGKLNKTCRERFRDTFDQVDGYFRETYPRLVGGGQARLLLTDEEDLLETGVDIMVQPPGKKLQSLTLLSGGEMAMTAIALIFSLFRVKPSPFCLLDEVDAPLDEGNGARFNQTLREMAQLSQFIVITHNKKTMECADTLYGVTMAVPGVSRLVTVQLD